MSYVNYLDQIILKSTFQIDSKIAENAFIDSTGEIYDCESHHHVEMALKLIHEMDSWRYYYKNDLKDLKSRINKAKFGIELLQENKIQAAKKLFDKSFWFYDFPNDNPKLLLNQYNQVLKMYEKDYKTISERLKQPSEIDKFKQANKNRGYDAAEYLIVIHGYIAVENSYLLYHNVKQKQISNLNCYVEKDDSGKQIIMKLSDEEVKQLTEKKIKELLSDVEWFRESSHRFHCPSGFIRQSYLNWENQCRKYGLNPNDLIYR